MMWASVDNHYIERAVRARQVLGILVLSATVDIGELEIGKSDFAHDRFVQRAATDGQNAVGSRELTGCDQFPQSAANRRLRSALHAKPKMEVLKRSGRAAARTSTPGWFSA
jgi:hypothetical protein